MSRVQVLVTTMHQTGFDKFYEMNLQTDTVLANQADSNFIEEKRISGKKVKLVTTDTRGLSKNRNIAMENISDATEYIVFSDDDLILYDNYENIIISEFEKCPDADAIRFNINAISERKLSMKPISELKRLRRHEVTSYGVCGLVVRKEVLLNKKLAFNERFGTGTVNYCGEDSIFYQEMFKKNISLYCSPEYIADIDQKESSWFAGYTEKYFIVAGMIINECYPILSYALVARSAIKAHKRGRTLLGFWKILKCYYRGIFKNISEKFKLRKETRNDS